MVLLAEGPSRCTGPCPKLRWMPTLCRSKPYPPALQTIPITWPFAVWGLDMVGPLKGGSHKKKYLLVMVDKFTKWIEAKPVKTAEVGPVVDFITGIVHRYGVPHSIITDNGSNFTADEVKTWCSKMGIKLDYAFVYHPQTNGQVERANCLIMSGIKPRLVRSLKESDTHWSRSLTPYYGGCRPCHIAQPDTHCFL